MKAKHREEKYLFTQLFEAASKNLILSFPVHDEEKELIPSLFIKPLKPLLWYLPCNLQSHVPAKNIPSLEENLERAMTLPIWMPTI